MKIDGGSLSVYGGSYEAGQGDGIAVFGGERVQIFGGTFVGRDSYWIDGSGTYYGGGNVTPRSGPAASYAFKAYGGTTEIYGGIFGTVAAGEVGSGAYVTGDSEEERARVTVADGTFSVSDGNSGGQMGFAVGPYAEVTFGTRAGHGPLPERNRSRPHAGSAFARWGRQRRRFRRDDPRRHVPKHFDKR